MATRAFLLCGDEKAVHAVTQILDELEVSFEHSSEPAFTLKRLAAQKFDLLIVDCDNVQNATQVFNSARASNLNKNSIAIAIVEGKAGVPNAFRLGASLVLTKPVALEQVRNTLRTGIGMTRKDAPEPKTPATFVPAIAPSVSAPVAPTVPAMPAPAAPVNAVTPTSTPLRTLPVAPATAVVTPQGPTPDQAPKVSAVTPPAAPKPAPVVPRPVASAPVPESKPAPAAEEGKPAPVAQTVAKAAAAAAGAASAPVKSNFDSIFTVPATSDEVSTNKNTKKTEKAGELEDLKSALESSLKIHEPASEDNGGDLDPDDDLGVPSFGGMGKQPFAGEEVSRSSGSKGWLIAALLLVVVGGAAYGAWATQPGFRKLVAWEYLNLSSKIAAIRGQAPVSAPAHPVAQASATPVPVAAAPAPEPGPTPSDLNTSAANAGAGATPTTPTSNAAASATPAQPVSATLGDSPAQKTATVQPAKQDTTPNHPVSNPALVAASASIPPTTAAKSTGSDLLEVPEDFADDQIVHRVHPNYPKQARARKLHGTVVLEAVVSKQGKVDSLQLVSGDPVLAQAAADAVKQWRYKPYLHNGEYTEFQTRVTVDFKEPELLKTTR